MIVKDLVIDAALWWRFPRGIWVAMESALSPTVHGRMVAVV
jgi:hypothetical protein